MAPDETARAAFADGMVIDSVVVTGNARVHDWVLLREMELRPGSNFDAELFGRDARFIADLSVIADVDASVESAAPGHCIVRYRVTERPGLLTSFVYPVLEYDFNRERLEYGVRWSDVNFRGRLEHVSAKAIRDNLDRDRLSAGWSTRFVGWRQIGVSVGLGYFNRHDAPDSRTIVEQTRVGTGVSLPLTGSRARRAHLLMGLDLTDNRLAERDRPSSDELLLTPSLGARYDSRNSPLWPTAGALMLVRVSATRDLADGDRAFFLVTHDARWFHALGEHGALGLFSRVDRQIGDYPSYVRFGLGGGGTLRGYADEAFRGAHRWMQSVEVRWAPWRRRLVRLPWIGASDFGVGFAAFVDAGIAWDRDDEFAARNWHGSGGLGLRLYSPIQDVLRLDFGMTARGTLRVSFSNGLRF